MNKKWRPSLAVPVVLIALALPWMLRDSLFRALFSYHAVKTRQDNRRFAIPPPIPIGHEAGPYAARRNALVALIQDALCFTDDRLSFAATGTRTAPDELLASGRAHCVGYAAFFKATLEELLRTHAIDEVAVYHVVGKIHFCGFDIHRLTLDPFLTDHDYDVVVDRRLAETYVVDPSLHDLAGIGFVRGNWDAAPPSAPSRPRKSGAPQTWAPPSKTRATPEPTQGHRSPTRLRGRTLAPSRQVPKTGPGTPIPETMPPTNWMVPN